MKEGGPPGVGGDHGHRRRPSPPRRPGRRTRRWRASTITSEQARPSPSSSCPRQPTKNTSSMPSRSDDRVRVLALPLAREAAPDHQRGGAFEAALRACVGADQQRDPLDLGEAAHEEQHGRRARRCPDRAKRLQVAPRCRPRCPARRPRPTPGARSTSHSRQRARRSSAYSSPRSKRSRSTPLGIHSPRSRSTPQQPPPSSRSCGRDHDQAVAARRPARISAQWRRGASWPRVAGASSRRRRETRRRGQVLASARAAMPGRSVSSSGRSPQALGAVDHLQLGAVEVGDHGHCRAARGPGLVDRGQVVQVQHLRPRSLAGRGGAAAPTRRPGARPARATRRAKTRSGALGTVLEGGVHGQRLRDRVAAAPGGPTAGR